MKLKILYTHLIQLSEDLLITDTGTYAQKQKSTLNVDYQYCNIHQAVCITHQKLNKTTKIISLLLKKTNFG